MPALSYISTADELDGLIASEPNLLVNFTATWCGPCKAFAPVLEDVAAEEVLRVVKVDIDDVAELKDRYEVLGVPTTMLFSGGELMARFTGVKSKAELDRLTGPMLG